MSIDIGSVEKIIRSGLKSLGYFKIIIDELNENSLKILADGDFRSILLEVKISRMPNEPKSLSRNEINQIKEIATYYRREPWFAKVKIDSEGNLAESIEWTNLSKVS